MHLKTTLLLPLIFLAGCQRVAETPAPVTESSAQTGAVTIEINQGESTETIVVDDVAEGSTVEQVMRLVSDPQIGIRGRGITAFVDRIGDVSTSSTEGWTYEIDGEFANEGIGSMTLSPPTTVTWTFSDASDFEAK